MGFDKDLRDLIRALQKAARRPLADTREPTGWLAWPNLRIKTKGDTEPPPSPRDTPTHEKPEEAAPKL